MNQRNSYKNVFFYSKVKIVIRVIGVEHVKIVVETKKHPEFFMNFEQVNKSCNLLRNYEWFPTGFTGEAQRLM